MALFAKLILPLSAPGLYTYSIPKKFSKDVNVGDRVIVQFGKGKNLYTGIVHSVLPKSEEKETKEILELLDNAHTVTNDQLKFWSWMADYYMTNMGSVMNAALPGQLNLSSESVVSRQQDIDLAELGDSELVLVNNIPETNISLKDLKHHLGTSFKLKSLNQLLDQKIIGLKETVRTGYKPKLVTMLQPGGSLQDKPFEEIVQSLNRAPAQLKALMYFIEETGYEGQTDEAMILEKASFLKRYDLGQSAVKSLLDKNILKESFKEKSRLTLSNDSVRGLKALNEMQSSKLREIKKQFEEKQTVLLHGVTSSGKTEIYAHLIQEALNEGGTVLYLLPEIALTNQLIRRLRQYFADQIAVYHSRLNANERVEIWNDLLKGKESRFKVILGARSAIFLPFHDLKLIVVDEEHDRSFKQQSPAPRYSGRDAAVVLAALFKAKVLLGSATPSLESQLNAMSGKYGLVELFERFGGFKMPELDLVDVIDSRRRRRMTGSFTNKLLDAMDGTIDAGEQIILFQNRRGYAPFIVCEQCSHTPSCVNCDVSLTYHKFNNRLVCHQCGYSIPKMNQCQECGSSIFLDKGLGTERIEEELQELRPEWRLARFDLDSTRKKNAFSEIIENFENGEIDVLIGTQMVTKGLDFENVGLVGIMNADQMLKFPDFRSFERTFQMLTQVSGRAGRKKNQGKVVIQTYDPGHPIIQHVLSNDYQAFANAELIERKQFKYSPYFRMIEVHLRHRDRAKLLDGAKALGNLLKTNFGESLLGPEFPYIERLRNYYTMHFILRINKDASMKEAKGFLELTVNQFLLRKEYKSIQVIFDVDPN